MNGLTRPALVIASAVYLIALACAGFASVTISGTVTASGGGPLVGAIVRTDGDSAYTSTTSSTGSYTLNVPAGTWVVLSSAPGRIPQRYSIGTQSDGASVTTNFALRTASSTLPFSLPAPLQYGEPPSAVDGPGDSFPVAFVDMSALPTSGAPQIAGWNETVKPDESFTVTGARFTTRTGADAGTDTTVWVWAQNAASGNLLRQAKVWHVTENSLTATMPDDIPFGMYLVWVENSAGVSAPVCINKTIAQWVGPLGNTVQAGNTKRVFGRNMSSGHGTTASYVYIQPSTGGSFISCPVSTVNPYTVEFTVPLATANGNYKVYVHNGHGGVYGWSDGLDLIVAPDWVRDSYEIALSPSGGDDTSAIQSAVNTLGGRANGGTLRLAAGTFKTYSQITLPAKVRVAGAGMNSTTIELRLNAAQGGYLYLSGSNITVEGLTLKGFLTGSVAQPSGGVFSQPYPTPTIDSFKLLNSKVTTEDGVYCMYGNWGMLRTEMSGCVFYRAISAGWRDGWVHDCTLYGGPFGIWPPFSPGYVGETEAAYNMTTNAVFEYSHVETENWPNDGNGNYSTNANYGFRPWAKRVALIQNAHLSHNYIANLTTTNVAVQDNRGEMFLFHGVPSQWVGNVLSQSGLTMNLQTNGTVNGQPGPTITDYAWSYSGNYIVGGSIVPDYHPSTSLISVDGSGAIIISGKGLGQQRMVVSHTSTSITIDRSWLVAPDSTSVILIAPLYVDNTIYDNDLNAFPPNYPAPSAMQTASTGIDFDGNGWNNAVEGNTSRRTNFARRCLANGGPCYWNVMRNETALDTYSSGFEVSTPDDYVGANGHYVNPLGITSLGNAYRESSSNKLSTASVMGEGCIVEKMTLTATIGYGLAGTYRLGGWSEGFAQGFAIYRNGQLTVNDTPLQPVYISNGDARQYLVGNTYSGNSQPYWFATGLSAHTTPVPQYRVAKFSGYAGYTLRGQIIQIANAGTAAMTWTAVPSDPWISAAVQSNGTQGAESTAGRLLIGVDTTGMAVGRHWGSVAVTSADGTANVGVCVDVLSGIPTNQSPIAAFTASPTSVTAPRPVAFNATASYDSDGAIANYFWDFGDGTYGSGVSVSHSYASQGTYTPVLTVTDNQGSTDQIWTNITVAPTLSAVTLSGSPTGAIDPGTSVTLTATANGGYQTLYRFLVNSGSGWMVLRDYQQSNTYSWTTATAGYYEIKVQAKASDSTNTYDVTSSIVSYPVGQIPLSGMKLWLKADAGVTKDGNGLVSVWADQSGSGNNVSQSISTNQPTVVDNVVNGRPAIRFAGGSQALQSAGLVLTTTASFTSFEVIKYNSIPASTNQYVWWNGDSTAISGYGSGLSTLTRTWCGWANQNKALSDTTNAAVGTWYEISSRYGSNSHQMWVNGTYIGSIVKTGSNFTNGFFSVGNYGPASYQGLYGDIAELLIYNRSLSDTERSNVENYLSARWNPVAPVAKDRLKDVKNLPDGVLVSITSAKVATSASSTFSDGGIYIEEPDRTCGMKVLNAGAVDLWDNLVLTATTDTDIATGEKILRVTSATSAGNTPLGSLGMTNRTFSASGQLVTVWGKVTGKTSSYFTLDDGSGSPVKVETDGLSTPMASIPDVGVYASATGIAACMPGGAAGVRVRSASDIRTY